MPDLPKDILSRIFGIVNRLDIYLFFSEYIYPIDINIDCLLYARQELLIKRSYRHVIKLLSMKDAMQWSRLIEHHYINETRFIKYMSFIEKSNNKVQIWRAFQKYVVPSFKFYKIYASKIEWTSEYLFNTSEKVISYGIQKKLIDIIKFDWKKRTKQLSNKFIQQYYKQLCMKNLCVNNLLLSSCSHYRKIYCENIHNCIPENQCDFYDKCYCECDCKPTDCPCETESVDEDNLNFLINDPNYFSDITDNSDEDDFGSTFRALENNNIPADFHISVIGQNNRVNYRDNFNYTSYIEFRYVDVLTIKR